MALGCHKILGNWVAKHQSEHWRSVDRSKLKPCPTGKANLLLYQYASDRPSAVLVHSAHTRVLLNCFLYRDEHRSAILPAVKFPVDPSTNGSLQRESPECDDLPGGENYVPAAILIQSDSPH